MYLTKVENKDSCPYIAHKKIKSLFEEQRVLFQQNQRETVVLSEKGLPFSRDLSSETEKFVPGYSAFFSLRINPVKTTSAGKKKWVEVIPSDRIASWLNGVYEKNGFIADCKYRYEPMVRFNKHGRECVFASVFVGGILTVKDRDLFLKAVNLGIGKAKFVGFGMLNVFDSF